jgi:23S rRNA pseudouridine2604 synthase
MEEITYPIRINRYLAIKGFSTRRGADDLITSGKVRINGKKAELGSKVEESDVVDVSGSLTPQEKEFTYIAYYKPRGIITHSPQGNERSIAEVAGFPKLFPIGRLDKASEGLIILTDDGRVTDRLLHPRFKHEKEYEVVVREDIPPLAKKVLEEGVKSEGEWLKAKKVTVLGAHKLSIILTEGKKHQVRRMLSEARMTVEQLVRVRVMGVHLGALKPGSSRALRGLAKKMFLEGIGL